jgi:glucokinase
MQLDARPAVLAFDVGGTTVKAEVIDDRFEVLARTTTATVPGPALVDVIAKAGAALLEELSDDRRATVGAVGLALPGIVDAARGVGVFAANVGLRDTPVGGPLSERLGLPVAVGHDVTAAAEAERRLGAAADVEDPVVVVIGTGIAAVSYVHGRRVRGASGQAGELGHLVVRPDGPSCACGSRGCLEAVASASAVVRGYRQATGADVEGASDVVALLGTDPAADRVWQQATEALGDGLLAAVALLAPGAIVLGGGLAEAGDALLKPVRERMLAQAPALTVPPLVAARLRSRAGVVGAALLALDRTEHRS